ncbi:MAG: nickel-type superoxide dismutase maturation protease [Candidatus Saccharibacteria bacterium]|nr:nickel-type superoxide dismutase maturation protease [Candidatus Saccharibacteria bacterium]
MSWPLGIYRVSGDSMLPTYQPGDTLLGLRWFKPKKGDVVIANRDRPLIKRVSHVNVEGIFVEGDNPRRSTDSRTFGLLRRDQIEAKVILKL